MSSSAFSRFALSISIAAAMLAGCGGPEPPAGAPGAMPLAAKVSPGSTSPPYLYVTNTATAEYPVNIFLRDHPFKGIVHHLGRVLAPSGIFIDSQGIIYVTTAWGSGDNSVWAYKRGAPKPFRIYSGADCAFDVVAASDGTVYIADACGLSDYSKGDVAVYPPGQTKPSRLIHPGGSPYALALDSHDNLYVGYNYLRTYWGQVKRYRPGARHGDELLPEHSAFFITGVGIDKHGALLVANSGAIHVFTAKGQPPSRVIHTGQSHVDTFAFDRLGNTIYVTSGCTSGSLAIPLTSSGCGKRANTVVALDYATGKRLWTLSEPDWVPVGVAVWPSAQF
jgi:DNA-binding beta-propeller fold protein YncE